MQRSVGHHHEARLHAIATIGGDDPDAIVLVPANLGDLGLETRIAIQIEVPSDGLAVGEDLRRARVLLLGDVPDFFEKGQIDVRLDVAGRARVAVPVPGAAEVATLLHDAQALDTGLPQTSGGEQSAESAADHDHLGGVEERTALHRRDVWILQVMSEATSDLDVLLVAVGAQTLVALQPVLVA